MQSDDYNFEERAGILEFDAGFEREIAEQKARKMLRPPPPPPPKRKEFKQ